MAFAARYADVPPCRLLWQDRLTLGVSLLR
jgi:hypothetical protein